VKVQAKPGGGGRLGGGPPATVGLLLAASLSSPAGNMCLTAGISPVSRRLRGLGPQLAVDRASVAPMACVCLEALEGSTDLRLASSRGMAATFRVAWA
jgi:hypothetical protein